MITKNLFYLFRQNPVTKEFHVHNLDEDWEKLRDESYSYASSFTDHIAKFVESIIESAQKYEGK